MIWVLVECFRQFFYLCEISCDTNKAMVSLFQLREMQSQLELRDSQIYELKRLYKEARDGDGDGGRCLGEDGKADLLDMMQQQNRELQARIAELEYQLRSVMAAL